MTSETDLAKRFGLPRTALKAARDDGGVEEGRDWENKGQGIQYSDGGIQRLYSWLNSQKNSSSSEASEIGENVLGEEALVVGPRVVDVTISRLWRGNARRMEIEHEGKKGILQVKDSKNFMVGMVVKAMYTEGSLLYHYRGRLPRRKGQL